MLPGQQAHHLIPIAVAQRSPLLRKIGMDLDHFSNGIPLHALERHRGFHRGYSDAVEIVLNKIDARNLPIEQAEQLILKLQSRLRGLILAGMPLYKGQGATVSEWTTLLLREF